MRLDRAHAQVELPRDLLVGVAERDQAEDLALALGEVVLGLAHDETGCEGRMDVDPVGEHRLDRAHELLVCCVLDHVALRSELEGLVRVGRLVLHREDHDAGAALAQVGDHVEPRPVAQRQVEDDDIGLQGARPLERVAHARGLTDDLDLAARLEHPLDAAAHELVVVDQEHADHAASIRVSKRTRAPPPAGRSRSSRPPTMRARSIMPSTP